MIWTILPAMAAYLVVALALRQGGLSLVGGSPAGKKAVPVVAALWPLALLFLLVVGFAAAIDTIFECVARDVFGDEADR